MPNIEAEDRAGTFVSHTLPESVVDLGEVRMNYATVGSSELPALLLIPAQTESWWGYEEALPLLGEHFQTYAVDLRGQGRSSWTPGRYTLDNLGNDLVRFIDLVIGRPVIVSGNSSGGVLSAWLSAYAKPGKVRASVWEDAPLFASEFNTSCGQSIRQAVGPLFALSSKWLGDQWTIGDWKGMLAAIPAELPPWMPASMQKMTTTRPQPGGSTPPEPTQPPQNMKEYDPEWGRSFVTGTATTGCDHARMLSAVRAPALLTHHYRDLDPATGSLMGALSDQQAQRVRELVTAAGQRFDYVSLPGMAHSMHAQDPGLFTKTIVDWVSSLESAL